MKIERIQIASFGRLHDLDLTLQDGINILEGPNESGKTTVAAFIRFAFYGLSGRAENGLSPREQYLSFGTREASGSLTLSCPKGNFRIERALVQNARGISEHLTVVDLSSGAIVKNADPAVLFLGGTPEEVFCRTAFVGQADGSTVDGKKVGQAIENILTSADESVNTKKAIKKLDDARVMLLYKNKKGGKIYELELERDDLIARAHQAEDDCRLMEEKKKLLADTVATLEKNREQLAILEEKLAYTDALRRMGQIERSKEAEQALEQATKQLEEKTAGLQKGDFCPDDAYLASLEAIGKQMVQMTDEKRKIKAKIEALRVEAEKEEAPEDPEQLSSLLSLRKKTDRFRSTSFISLFFALLFAVVGIIIDNLALAVPLPVIGIGAFVYCFIVSRKAEKEVFAILDELGADTEEQAIAILTNSAVQNARIEAAKEAISDLESEYAAVKAGESAMIHDAAALGAKWEKEIADTRALAELIAEARVACHALSEAKQKKDHAAMAYKGLFTPHTEKEVAALCEILEGGGSELEGDEYTKASNNRKFYRQTIDLLGKRQRETEHIIIELRARTEIPDDLRQKAAELEKRIEALRFRHDAYLLAGQKLAEASSLLRARITPALSGEASAFVCHTTEGKYPEIGVTDDFELNYNDRSATRTTEYLSCGTKDLAYLGLRLGLVKTLFAKDVPPLVFDESFSRLDDRRLAMVFTYLAGYSEDGKQIILFTSGRRERKFAEAMGNCHLYQL